MTADEDLRVGKVAANQLAHVGHLGHVGNDRGDPDDVVAPRSDLLDESITRGEIQQGRRRADVFLDQLDAPGSVEHAQREAALNSRHLVVVQLHRVDRPAAELVVLCVGPEDAGQQHSGSGALRMHGMVRCQRLGRIHQGVLSRVSSRSRQPHLGDSTVQHGTAKSRSSRTRSFGLVGGSFSEWMAPI